MALTAAGCSRGDMVKVTAHLEDLARDRTSFDAPYRKHFGEPSRRGRRLALSWETS